MKRKQDTKKNYTSKEEVEKALKRQQKIYKIAKGSAIASVAVAFTMACGGLVGVIVATDSFTLPWGLSLAGSNMGLSAVALVGAGIGSSAAEKHNKILKKYGFFLDDEEESEG